MREIKFRCWDKENKVMFIPEHFSFTNGELICIDGGSIVPYGSYEVMQYTGLTDKTGKPIYEGDILQWPVSKEIAVVEYCLAYTGFRLINKNIDCNASIGLNIGDKGMAKIIGNIHENPELLECQE